MRSRMPIFYIGNYDINQMNRFEKDFQKYFGRNCHS